MIERCYDVPTASSLVPLALDARAHNRHYVRFQIPVKRIYLERYPIIWDRVRCKTVGRHIVNERDNEGIDRPIVAAIIVQLHPSDILNAAEREKKREAELFRKPIAANVFPARGNVITNR